ncbi:MULTISPECIES: DnaB-like helicase C-terminal domain-containing protein [Thermoactinomyces]|uniref:DNA 5'-3' helicase n=1 Tax=Thermoactinomyces daqus TaxID=1329516 RepID=A0A7W2AI83_9BACL|nr:MULTISPECIES: DnaB-like helicase C-terminal domain-containing protein [Thermoactinomyces]MBA4543972.1 AAA family ATPase [Thermoactinomyces daqus]MBH8599095.1 AAA family ATPase [Thermoactinomyces sp. CICC 10523]MBH8607974.1 AAA family ATPase [Thermoactinomyces sp. CICC 10521]
MNLEQLKIIEAEQAVIGSVLIDNKVMDDLAFLLEARDFSTFAHEMIWKAMLYMHSNDKVIDPITLTEMLVIYKRLDEVGGVPYLNELAAAVPTSANAKHYAEIVRKRSIRRRVATVGEQIKQLVLQDQFENNEDLFRRIEQLADSVRPGIRNDLVHIKDTRKDYMDYLRQKDDLILTGFKQFDEWMGGLGRGWLYILAARPSVGKTAKMLKMARGIAAQDHGAVAIISQEMKKEALYNRMIASITGIPVNRLRLKKLTPTEFEEVDQAFNQLEQLPLHIADGKAVTIDEVRSMARQLKRKYGRLGAIFIDYLGIMNIPQPTGMTRAQAVGEVSKKAKNLAMEVDCPLIMLAQMNREGKKALKPSLEHLRESGDIEQDADVVEFLWENPEDMNPGLHLIGARVVQSFIAKGRDIGVNEFRYAFKGWIQDFVDLPPLKKE